MKIGMGFIVLSSVAVLVGCGGGGGSTTVISTDTGTNTVVAPSTKFTALASITVGNNDASANPRFAVGDFNGDGRQDIVFRMDPDSAFDVSNQGTNQVRIFTQNNDGTYVDSTAQLMDVPLSLINVAQILTADFNGDGKSDIVVAASGTDPYVDGKPQEGGVLTGGLMHFILSQPDGKYKEVAINAEPTFLHSIAIGDINGDGSIDVFALSAFSHANQSYLLINDGKGNFTVDRSRLHDFINNPPAHTEVISTYPNGSPKETRVNQWTASAMFDMNGDGKPDLMLLPNTASDKALVFLNDGSGYFTKGGPIQVDASPYGPGRRTYNQDGSYFDAGSIQLSTVVADVNGDGINDVISIATKSDPNQPYIYYQGTAVSVLIGDGKGNFKNESTRVQFGHEPGRNYSHYMQISIADFNNDGKIDLVLTRSKVQNYSYDGATATRFLKNDGTGHFAEVTGESMGLPDLTYVPVKVGSKNSFVGMQDVNTGNKTATGHWIYNLIVQSYLAP